MPVLQQPAGRWAETSGVFLVGGRVADRLQFYTKPTRRERVYLRRVEIRLHPIAEQQEPRASYKFLKVKITSR